MSEPALLHSEPFAEAKSRLSDLMSEVVREHRPVLIDRHRGKERAVLTDAADLLDLLDQLGVRFEPKVSFSEEGGLVVRLPELNLIAGGEDYEEAMEELGELIEEYAEDFLARPDFYRHTDRWRHAPWLLRFALTPVAERPALLSTPPAQTDEQVPAQPA